MTDNTPDKHQNKKEIPNRDDLIILSCSLLNQLDKKISGRYRPSKNEAMYLQTVRAITGLIDTTNRLIRDSELQAQGNPTASDQPINKEDLLERMKKYDGLFDEDEL